MANVSVFTHIGFKLSKSKATYYLKVISPCRYVTA